MIQRYQALLLDLFHYIYTFNVFNSCIVCRQIPEFLLRSKVKMCLKDHMIGPIGNLQARAMRALEAKKDGGWGNGEEWKGDMYSRDATYLAGAFFISIYPDL